MPLRPYLQRQICGISALGYGKLGARHSLVNKPFLFYILTSVILKVFFFLNHIYLSFKPTSFKPNCAFFRPYKLLSVMYRLIQTDGFNLVPLHILPSRHFASVVSKMATIRGHLRNCQQFSSWILNLKLLLSIAPYPLKR